MPPDALGRPRRPPRLRGGALLAAVVAVVVVGFGLGLWASGGLDRSGDDTVVAGPPDATATVPPSTATASTEVAPASTTTTSTAPAPAAPSTTDPAPPATEVPTGAPGSAGVLTVGYDGQEALGRLVLAPGETRWIILANVGGSPLTWTARSTGAAALGDGTSFAGVLGPGQSGGVPVTGAATSATGARGTVTLDDGTASTVVEVVIG